MPGKAASLAALEIALNQTILGMTMGDLFTTDRATVKRMANSRSDQPERRFASHVAKVVRAMADLTDLVNELNLAPQPIAAADAGIVAPPLPVPGDAGAAEHRLAIIPDRKVIPTVAEPTPLTHVLLMYNIMVRSLEKALVTPWGAAAWAWLAKQPFFIVARLWMATLIWTVKWGHVFINIWLGAVCLGFFIYIATHPEWLVLGPLRLAKWMPTYANWALGRIADHAQAEVYGWFSASGSDPPFASGRMAPHPQFSENQFMEDATGDYNNISIAVAHLAQAAADQRHSIEVLRRSQWLWASVCAVGTTLGALLGARIHR